MNELSKKEGLFEFGEFRLDSREKRLWRNGEAVSIQPKAFDLLAFLITNQGHLISKDEILRAIWEDTVVEEGNLSLNIHALRKLLGENNRFIETVPRRGYRWTGEVKEINVENIAVEQNISNITVRQTAIPTVVDGTSVINQQTVVLTEEAASQVAENLHKQIKRQNFRYFAASFLIFAVLAAAAFYFLRPTQPKTEKSDLPALPPPPAAVRTIAVLLFHNLTKNKADDALSIGLTDSLITKLGSVKRIAVRPTSAVLPFAENSSPQEASEKLKVENVLEGTIQRAGKRLKVSVQLVQMPENKVLWAKSLDEEATDLLKIQDSIALEIANSLLIDLSQEEQTLLARAQTRNPEAFQFYLQGRYFWNKRTPDDLQKSIELFNQAKEKDPNYALAYAGLADSYQLLAEYRKFSLTGSLTPAEAFEKSREASRKALELNENSAEAHTSLAYTIAFYDWNWTEAEREFKRAIEINPNYATARQWYGECMTTVGRFDEAYFELRKAEELDPTSLIIKTDVAAYYYLTRQFDKSLEQTQKILEINPNFIYAHAYQWICYEQKGMEKEAVEALIKGDSLILPPEYIKLERETYEQNGWQALWKVKFEKYNEPPFKGVFDNYLAAIGAFRAGETDKTFELLKNSGDARERWFVNLKYDPQWDKIRADERFAELVRKANLTP
jgi:DNA-binding winged helix-turn-helix (wHTH) protein/TolB-like protein